MPIRKGSESCPCPKAWSPGVVDLGLDEVSHTGWYASKLNHVAMVQLGM